MLREFPKEVEISRHAAITRAAVSTDSRFLSAARIGMTKERASSGWLHFFGKTRFVFLGKPDSCWENQIRAVICRLMQNNGPSGVLHDATSLPRGTARNALIKALAGDLGNPSVLRSAAGSKCGTELEQSKHHERSGTEGELYFRADFFFLAIFLAVTAAI